VFISLIKKLEKCNNEAMKEKVDENCKRIIINNNKFIKNRYENLVKQKAQGLYYKGKPQTQPKEHVVIKNVEIPKDCDYRTLCDTLSEYRFDFKTEYPATIKPFTYDNYIEEDVVELRKAENLFFKKPYSIGKYKFELIEHVPVQGYNGKVVIREPKQIPFKKIKIKTEYKNKRREIIKLNNKITQLYKAKIKLANSIKFLRNTINGERHEEILKQVEVMREFQNTIKVEELNKDFAVIKEEAKLNEELKKIKAPFNEPYTDPVPFEAFTEYNAKVMIFNAKNNKNKSIITKEKYMEFVKKHEELKKKYYDDIYV